MTLLAPLLRRLHWLNLPGVVLIALLQRTPVLRVLTAGAENLAASPAAHLLRSVFTAATLGATHSLAGATAFVINPARPYSATVGTPIAPITFTYTGTPAEPAVFQITGSLPPGLSFSPAPVNGSIRSRVPVISGTPTQAGSYTVFVQGFSALGLTNNVREPIAFTVTGGATATTAPVFTAHPTSITSTAGTRISFAATATGSPTPAYQWRRNGADLADATASTLILPSVQASDVGDYTVVASNSAGSVTSSAARLTLISGNPGARLGNLSVRTALALGEMLTVGVVVGDGARDILVRAVGPTLAAFGLTGVMADPRLELFDSRSVRISANDNWSASLAPTFVSVGAFALRDQSFDAAFIQRLDAAYSIQTRGTGPGLVLVEAYDTGAPSAARLVNVSARNRVGTGDGILIAGFNVSGSGAKPLLIRAVGPKLSAFGVGGSLTDPKLEIYNSFDTIVAQNDNWDPSLAGIFDSVGAFGLDPGSRDAALVVSLPPGSYTAQVRGADGGTGEALIEIYEIR